MWLESGLPLFHVRLTYGRSGRERMLIGKAGAATTSISTADAAA